MTMISYELLYYAVKKNHRLNRFKSVEVGTKYCRVGSRMSQRRLLCFCDVICLDNFRLAACRLRSA